MSKKEGSKPLVIEDSFEGYSIEQLVMTKHYADYVDHVLVPEGLVKDRVAKMAQDILDACKTQKIQHLHTLCILKGGFKFFGELHEQLNALNAARSVDGVQLSLNFVKVKSYTNTESSQSVQIDGLDDLDLKDKDVLVVEDIVDTGLTMQRLLSVLKEKQTRSVRVAVLVRKRTTRNKSNYRADFTGFEIPDRFIIGWGFDYNQIFRDLKHICTINQKGIDKFKR